MDFGKAKAALASGAPCRMAPLHRGARASRKVLVIKPRQWAARFSSAGAACKDGINSIPG